MEEYGFMKRLALLTLFCSLATGVIAAPNDGWNEGMILFKALSQQMVDFDEK